MGRCFSENVEQPPSVDKNPSMRDRIGLVVLVKMRGSLYQPRRIDRYDISHVLSISRDKRMVYNPLWINPASKNSTKLDAKVNLFTMSSVFVLLSINIRCKISLENSVIGFTLTF